MIDRTVIGLPVPAPKSNVHALPFRHAPGRLLSKKQLAAELARSTRWVELRMREGMPVAPRANESEHARFDLNEVRDWLGRRAEAKPLSLEERVARIERTLGLTDRRTG